MPDEPRVRPRLFLAFVITVTALAMLLLNVRVVLITWVQQNWIIVTVSVISIVVIGTGILYKIRKEQKRKKFEREVLVRKMEWAREVFVKSQKDKGLEVFVDRHGVERWGKPEEVKVWRMQDEEEKMKETLLYRVIGSIKKFEPSRRYGNEYAYQTELQGWLKREFPDSKIEIQTGASRPDIVIGGVAIEIKGPTDNQALNTLTTKCLKYHKYYSNLIIVLFEPRFSESNYSAIAEGMKNLFPFVEIIRKS